MWSRRALVQPVHCNYQRLECSMVGDGYDVRPHLAAWPFLVDQNEATAYPGCQALAREARDNGSDGPLTISARRAGGVNVPVFRRRALSDPAIVGAAAVVVNGGRPRVERRL